MWRQVHRIMVVMSIIALTDTLPSRSPVEKLSTSSSYFYDTTESLVDNEIIYATEVVARPGTQHPLGEVQAHQSPQPFYIDEDLLATDETYPEVLTIMPDTSITQNPFNDEILEKASRLSYSNFDNVKSERTTFTAWNDKEDEGSVLIRDSNNIIADLGLNNINYSQTDKNRESAGGNYEEDDILHVNLDENRLERMTKHGERKMESYSEPIGVMDENGEISPRRTTSTAPLVVWGEVGRGIVAATLDYGKGEVGRKPLVLAGGRGRTRSGPYFEDDLPPFNISAPAGSTVYMDCRVAMLHDKVVTWAARRDDRLQLLTVGKQAYSADKRFSLSFRYPNNWRLKIVEARRQDQGLYECQVAAHPPIIKQIYLAVISPEVNIWDESGRSVVERYYKAGSSLQLTCSAWQLLQPPEYLGWWKDSQHLTEDISCNVTGSDSATCTLMVDQVARSHAGTYVCGAFPWSTDAGVWSSGHPPIQLQATNPNLPYTLSKAEGFTNATVAVHVLHGNLLGVAVLPNTGKSAGTRRANYISVYKLIMGLSVALYSRRR